ncbi:MAG TPA: AAA family ATPase [Acidimicrobiales bacterium]
MTNRTIDNEPSDYSPSDFDPYEEAPQVIVNTWEPRDLGPVLRGESVGVVPTVLERNDGVALFYPACLNLLMGESESCKTWVALEAIKQEIQRGRHVALIDYEGSSRSIVERLQALGISDDQITEQFSYIQPSQRFTDLEQQIVIEECIDKRGTPSLVILDGVTEAMSQAGLNPDVGVDVVAFYDSAPKWFARRGSAVVLIDHVTKGSDNRGRYAIGSERKISGIDGAAYMVDLTSPFGRGKTGRIKLTVSKDRGGYVREHTNTTGVIAEVVLRSSPDGSVTVTAEAPGDFQSSPFRPTVIMEQMSKALEASPDGLGVRALRSASRGKTDTKALALELLVNEGFFAIKSGRGTSIVHTSVRPFPPIDRGSDDDIF